LADAASDVWLGPRGLSGAFGQGDSLKLDRPNCPKPPEPGSD
jgi:hypothetical protein